MSNALSRGSVRGSGGADEGGLYTSELDNVLLHKQRYILTVILSPDSTEQPRDEGGPNGSEYPWVLRSPSPEGSGEVW